MGEGSLPTWMRRPTRSSGSIPPTSTGCGARSRPRARRAGSSCPWPAGGGRATPGCSIPGGTPAPSAARWIQLPMAGVERMADAGLLDPGRTWTSAKGAYAEPVAEHALALALAGLRSLRRRISARSWGEPAGQSLYDEPVTILGGGGIAASLLELLAPFRVAATVVGRRGG